MKNIFTSLLIIALSINLLNAQKKDRVEYRQNWDKQKVFWGYYLGLNQKTYKVSYKDLDFAGDNKYFIDVEPSIGFDIGLIGNLTLNKNISLRLEPGLSSNTKKLTYTYLDLEDEYTSVRNVPSTYLRIPFSVKFNTDKFNNIRPYATLGVSYDYNFSSNEEGPDNESGGQESFRMKSSNFMYEVSAGMDFYLPYFIFSPSIRGVFAINNELVYDDNPDSLYTGNIEFLGTRGLFLRLSFH